MNALFKRLVLTVVALPSVYALAAVLTGYRHLAMGIVVSMVMGGGAAETGALLRGAGLPASRVLIPVAASTVPFAAYLETAGFLPRESTLIWLTALVAAVLAYSVLAAERGEQVSVGLPRSAGLCVQLLYPALLGVYIVRIAELEGAAMRYLLFFCLVFGNDSFAYLAGRAAKGRTSLGLKVSPGKTGAGYAAGSIATLAVALFFGLVFPQDFPYPLWQMCLLAALVALATFVGDLAESAMKRSAGVKDSGVVMLGRGGILDSVDSLVMSAPVFYVFFRLLGG